MKLAVNKYNVCLEGTKKFVCYYGYKTKKEAQEIANKYSEVTGKNFVVVNYK